MFRICTYFYLKEFISFLKERVPLKKKEIYILIYLRGRVTEVERKGERERDFPYSGSLPKDWKGQNWAAVKQKQELSGFYVSLEAQALVLSPAVFPGTSTVQAPQSVAEPDSLKQLLLLYVYYNIYVCSYSCIYIVIVLEAFKILSAEVQNPGILFGIDWGMVIIYFINYLDDSYVGISTENHFAKLLWTFFEMQSCLAF